ncbi:MAG: hypothetical protein ABW116_18255 [Candidatus Sedimenticola sp. 20ELBAFRAG]
MSMKFKSLACLMLLLPALSSAGFEEAEKANRTGDRVTAFAEYRAAALEGDIRAFGKLGGLYLFGVGTDRDYAKAFVWFGLGDLSGDRYAKGYRDAAAGELTPEELKAAEVMLNKYREKFGLDKEPAGR